MNEISHKINTDPDNGKLVVFTNYLNKPLDALCLFVGDLSGASRIGI